MPDDKFYKDNPSLDPFFLRGISYFANTAEFAMGLGFGSYYHAGSEELGEVPL